MKFWVIILVLAGIVCMSSFYSTLHYIPINEMSKAEGRIATIAGGRNVMRHAPRATEESRTVVRPSPDQLYSACVYDLSQGPVRFSGLIPDTYWSLSLFAHNTDNFFVVNDGQMTMQDYDFLLIKEGQSAPGDIPADRIITSPTKTGIALIRMFIPQDQQQQSLESIQQQGACTNLTTN